MKRRVDISILAVLALVQNTVAVSNWSDCIGSVYPCEGFLQETCQNTIGCKWLLGFEECRTDDTVPATVCSKYSATDKDACESRGCSWAPDTVPGTCFGKLGPCKIHMEKFPCLQTAGCDWRSSTGLCAAGSNSLTFSPNCSRYSNEAQCTSRSCKWANATLPPAPVPAPAPAPASTLSPLATSPAIPDPAVLTPSPALNGSATPPPLAEGGSLLPSFGGTPPDTAEQDRTVKGHDRHRTGKTVSVVVHQTSVKVIGDLFRQPAERIAAIVGAIGGTPFLVVIAYLAVTFAYKSEKRMIVEQVKRHLVMADIADDHGMKTELEAELMGPVRSAAGSITWRCLQMWDGFMGWRARTDSANKRAGIWLDKFETVRYASMLLALQKVNTARQSSGKTTLFGAWVKADSTEQTMLVTDVVRALLNIPEAQAQDLPKDPDVPSLQYKLCSIWQSCRVCCHRNKSSSIQSKSLFDQSPSV